MQNGNQERHIGSNNLKLHCIKHAADKEKKCNVITVLRTYFVQGDCSHGIVCFLGLSDDPVGQSLDLGC
jgi:hypothetical protein